MKVVSFRGNVETHIIKIIDKQLHVYLIKILFLII